MGGELIHVNKNGVQIRRKELISIGDFLIDSGTVIPEIMPTTGTYYIGDYTAD